MKLHAQYAHHDHGQKQERMKFLRIIFGCPEGARKWRILFFAMLLHSKKPVGTRLRFTNDFTNFAEKNMRKYGKI